MDPSIETPGDDVRLEGMAARLKERVYVTFTALATVLALSSHEESGGEAASTLLIAVLGTVLAVFLADVVSHIVVHEMLPGRGAVREMAQVSFGALGAVALPFIFVGLALADVWSMDAALYAASVALVVALVAIGFLAIRRVRLSVWKRLVVLLAEFALGALVLGLELLAHG
ncbi:hypothetical protein BH09ACT12_BH09ACT12_13780 [soil metagenome]